MQMKEMTVTALMELTASDSPAPGGGSVSALAASFAAALAAMVARLTVKKEEFASLKPEMEAVIARCDAAAAGLLEDVQRDASSFDAYMEALKLPKVTEEEKLVRRQAMQAALKHAAEVPLSVAEKAVALLPDCELVVAQGNPSSVTDGLVGAMMARSGALGALYNLKINLAAIKDEDYVAAMRQQAARIEAQANAAEARIRALAAELN